MTIIFFLLFDCFFDAARSAEIAIGCAHNRIKSAARSSVFTKLRAAFMSFRLSSDYKSL